MRRFLPGSTLRRFRLLLGVVGVLSLLAAPGARAEEDRDRDRDRDRSGEAGGYLGTYRIVNAPPHTAITITMDGTGATATVVTDAEGKATLDLTAQRWTAGTGQLQFVDPRPRARVSKWVELEDKKGVINVGWNDLSPRERAEIAFGRKVHYALGIGWGREIHEDSPSGGGIILQGRADYPLKDRWHVGVGGGYYWLGSTTTTWQGQTGEVRLSANPLWGEVMYDLKERGFYGDVYRDPWGNAGGYEKIRTHGIVPWVALGGGPYWRRVRGDFEDQNNSVVDFGMNVAVGLDDIARQHAAQIGLEARYHNVIRERLEGFQLVTLNLNVRF